MLTNIFLAIGMASAMGLGVVNTQNHDFIVNDNPSNVVYDDEEYSITFTSYELQEYTWVNLCNIVGNGTNIYRTTNFLGENDDEYIYDEYVIEDGTYALYYINGDNQITLNQSNLKNRFIFYLENEIADFGENYTWNLNSTIYDDIKQAIPPKMQTTAPKTDKVLPPAPINNEVTNCCTPPPIPVANPVIAPVKSETIEDKIDAKSDALGVELPAFA